jgi:hypothetical protein
VTPRRGRAGLAATLATVALVVGAGVNAVAVRAAEPTSSPLGGDPRSAGEGPGLVGQPLVAIGVVVAIAVVAVVATLAYVRATGGPRRDGRPPR